jgi:hypothetical protein
MNNLPSPCTVTLSGYQILPRVNLRIQSVVFHLKNGQPLQKIKKNAGFVPIIKHKSAYRCKTDFVTDYKLYR